jgi:hypothetical protein
MVKAHARAMAVSVKAFFQEFRETTLMQSPSLGNSASATSAFAKNT